jgi:alcohol oxidase
MSPSGVDRFSIRAGCPGSSDLTEPISNNGSCLWYRSVRHTDTRRQDQAHRCLHPLLQSARHPGLHALVESQIFWKLFNEEKSPVSAEYRPDLNVGQSKEADETRQIKARKLVVASTGSLGTSLLLQRWGVGDPAVL